MGSTRDHVLHLLKTRGPCRADALARRLGLTAMAVRHHLYALQEEELVDYTEEPAQGRGRPARHWRATAAADERFPDSHAELALDLIRATRTHFGEQGLAALVRARTERQLADYRAGCKPRRLAARVAYLARRRSAEGYLAEWGRAGDGSYWLVENHCPVCAAARTCVGLCDGELELFRGFLGQGVDVQREEHIVQGDRRCRYRIYRRK